MSTYVVNHQPYLQLGDAPLDGFKGSETDQVELLWQTKPGSGTGNDSFVVEYRLAGSSGPWKAASGSEQRNNIGTGGRVTHSVEIDGLDYNTEYEYRVQHLRGNTVVETFQNSFETRLAAGDTTAFSFAAYGDSAYKGNIKGFREVQGQINKQDLAFSLLLGDNIYDSGKPTEADLRFDKSINPEATAWNSSHIDYVAFGNHDVRTQKGDPSEDLYSVPIPTAGVDSPVALPSSEIPEHNYSFDYGDVHFITFDTNALYDSRRLDGILDWVEADAKASDSKWTVVFGHHPVTGAPEKPQRPGDNYYNQVVSRFNNVGVDLFLTGHTHTVSWTYPLLGVKNGKAVYVPDIDKNYDKGAGLVQGVFGTGGKSLRGGNYNSFPEVAQGFTADTNRRSENGFAKVDVNGNQLKVSYIAADNGEVIDSFTITDNSGPDATAPTLALTTPLDDGPLDKNPAHNALSLTTKSKELKFHLSDVGDGIDDNTVTSQTVKVTRNGAQLSASQDYTFSYDAANDNITLTSTNGGFTDGDYQITLNGGTAKIADLAGNQMETTNVSVEVDTTISQLTFQQGNGYTGTVDTYIQAGSPSSNHATATTLNIDGRDRGGEVQGLLRFDNLFGDGVGQIASNAKILSASLELQVTDHGDDMHFHRMLESWTDGATWNSLGNGVQTDGVEALSSSDVLTGDVNTGLLTLDVTQSLQAWLADPSSNYGWVITPTGSNGVDFYSSEGSNAPRLVVDFSVPSTPVPPVTPPPNTINGTVGDDSLTGSQDKDIIRGHDGADVLIGRKGGDELLGGRGADTLRGGQGNDTLKGSYGADILVGGKGYDKLSGGKGDDTFVFESVDDRRDVILDFGKGNDLIDMHQIFAGDQYASLNAFKDYVKLVQTGSNTKLQVDDLGDNGDKFRTVAILNNVTATDLTEAQFIV